MIYIESQDRAIQQALLLLTVILRCKALKVLSHKFQGMHLTLLM